MYSEGNRLLICKNWLENVKSKKLFESNLEALPIKQRFFGAWTNSHCVVVAFPQHLEPGLEHVQLKNVVQILRRAIHHRHLGVNGLITTVGRVGKLKAQVFFIDLCSSSSTYFHMQPVLRLVLDDHLYFRNILGVTAKESSLQRGHEAKRRLGHVHDLVGLMIGREEAIGHVQGHVVDCCNHLLAARHSRIHSYSWA